MDRIYPKYLVTLNLSGELWEKMAELRCKIAPNSMPLHMTLISPFPMEYEVLLALDHGLRDLSRRNIERELAIERLVSHFGPQNKHVVWIVRDDLFVAQLIEDMRVILADLTHDEGWHIPHRPYVPHLTLWKGEDDTKRQEICSQAKPIISADDRLVAESLMLWRDEGEGFQRYREFKFRPSQARLVA